MYFLTEAGKKGNEDALLKLAQINDGGLFGQYINIDQAKNFYQLAAERGNEEARRCLAKYLMEDEKDVANILTNLKHCVRA
jgi:TPR repeat protein